MDIVVPLVVTGILLSILSYWIYQTSWKINRFGAIEIAPIVRVFTALLLVIAGLLFIVAVFNYRYYHRVIPPETQETLFQGVTYIREVRSDPQLMVIHIVKIDLHAPGLSFLVTPSEPTGGRQLSAQTTSQFLERNKLQVAVNGDFFEPWWSRTLWDYYPHDGDPVDVFGYAVSKGVTYANRDPFHAVLYISSKNEALFNTPTPDIYTAISGNAMLLVDDKIIDTSRSDDYLKQIHPRTAVALSQDRQTLILIVVDGRQANYSEGATLPQLAQIVLDHGGSTAMNLDGGGSSVLVIEGVNGAPLILSSPIDNYVPGRERAVANHFGLYANR
jgi:hypothetical protein